MKRILTALPLLLWLLVVTGCMTVSEHKHLMEAQTQLYNELKSDYNRLQAECSQQQTEYERNKNSLTSCQRTLDTCQITSSALSVQLDECNSIPVVAPEVKECNVTEMNFEFPDSSKPADWLLQYQVPALRIQPVKNGLDDSGSQLYTLTADQLKALNSANVDLIHNVKGWKIWYHEVIENPANVMQQ